MFNEIFLKSSSNLKSTTMANITTRIDILFLGVKFTFSSKHGELNIYVSGEPLFLVPCDGNNFKITSEKIIIQISERDDDKKCATEVPFKMEKIGREKIDSVFNSTLRMNLTIDEMVFEISAINNGYILISSVDHGKIMVEPSSSNAIRVSAID
jgi:hypothetical protein